ncbi:transposase, partial [Bacteroidales bacterium OttesenSCG-928-C03]|nr:transposase [Bacteroidales bacterium OttesenSCG-928-C03]
RIGCHFIGMIKMGNTHYAYNGKSLTSKEIAADLNKKRKARHSKKLKCYYSEACVDFKGHEVKLFFCRYSKRAKWNGLLSTNTALNFEDAYRIYSKRWTIEVFFKECKQYLRLGKCQSQDFDAQIASASICVMQYNLLAVIKRFEGYETMGELFRKAQADTLELTVCDRIWQIIIELLSELAIIFDLEYELLMEKMLSENEQLTKIANLEIRTQTG